MRLLAPLRRDPDLPRWVLAAAVAGLVAGYAGFAIRSSRGLDLIEAADFLASIALLGLGGAIVFGAARVAMFQDWRVLVAALAVGVVLPVGYGTSERTLPGHTTDGTILVDLPPLEQWDNVAVSAHGKCTWEATHTGVTGVDSRRPAIRVPALGQPRMTAHVELGAEVGTMTILVAPPLGGEPVFRYSGTGLISRNDPTGRIGLVLAQAMPRERVGSAEIDPDLAALLETTAPPVASASVAWTCPPWP